MMLQAFLRVDVQLTLLAAAVQKACTARNSAAWLALC